MSQFSSFADALKQGARENLEGFGEAVGGQLIDFVSGKKPASTPTLEASAKPAAVADPAAAKLPTKPVWFWPLMAVLAVLILGGVFWFLVK